MIRNIWRKAILGCLLFWTIGFVCVLHAGEKPVPPKASFGVIQCKKLVVLWVILADGKVTRITQKNLPDDIDAFIAWLETGPSDGYVLPCMTST